MKERTYTQCRLERAALSGNVVTQTAWIPSEFAHIGNIVRIGEVDGWVVVGIGYTQTEDYRRERERDFKHQREASDI